MSFYFILKFFENLVSILDPMVNDGKDSHVKIISDIKNIIATS